MGLARTPESLRRMPMLGNHRRPRPHEDIIVGVVDFAF
jgi:hypothetical protein